MFKKGISLQVEVMEAIIYEDVDEIGETQTYEYIGGYFPVWAELIEMNKIPKDIIKGMNVDENSIIIASQHDYEFKRGDKVRLYGYEEYKIESVKLTIDPKYTNIIRMFPNSRSKYTWKIILLG